jgi:hypothetical protein
VMFIGVLGGVATFGFIGIFLGPTLLAVGFSLAQEILEQRRVRAAATSAEEAGKAVLAGAPAAVDTAAPSEPPATERNAPPSL